MAQNSRDPRKAAEARVGTTLNGKWTIDRILDIGGMGCVFVATHRNGKRAAIKMLHPEFASDGPVRERFLREGYVANKVGHSGAVEVLDDDTTQDGAAYLVMELLEGESFEGMLTRHGNRLGHAEVLAVTDQCLSVLAAAHDKGVIHRDIKPANIFITREGRVKILDFGLARVRDGVGMSSNPTAMGIVLGTSAFMPPEQARGKTNLIDARTDLFAVGAVMFRAMTGRFVHEAASPQERLFAAMQKRAPSLATIDPNASSAIVKVVDTALAFEQDKRFPNALAMQIAVREAFSDLRNAPERASIALANLPKPMGDLASVVIEVSLGDMAVPLSSYSSLPQEEISVILEEPEPIVRKPR